MNEEITKYNAGVPAKLPSFTDLLKEREFEVEQNTLTVLLNQPPHKSWLKEHPQVKVKKQGKDGDTNYAPLLYIPISRVHYLLKRIYRNYWVEILNIKLIANSPTVTVRLFVENPITFKIEHQDGVGSAPLQTDKDAGAIDFMKMKSGAVQMAAPAAESYAIKDAAEKFGKIFGRDLNIPEDIDYLQLLKEKEIITKEMLEDLYKQVETKLSPTEIMNAGRILNGNETNKFAQLYKILKGKNQ